MTTRSTTSTTGPMAAVLAFLRRVKNLAFWPVALFAATFPIFAGTAVITLAILDAPLAGLVEMLPLLILLSAIFVAVTTMAWGILDRIYAVVDAIAAIEDISG